MSSTSTPTVGRDGSAAAVPAVATVGQYLIDRLGALGVEHVFGIPGDYVLGLYKLIEESPIKLVGTTREDNAGFAADAYARIHGLGCICVTYCVGGLSTCNSIAGAYAEKSPVIVLGGSPGLSERAHNPLLHHKVKGFETQFEVFQKITVASAVLDRPETALEEIDRVLEAAVRYKRPVYLELPRDQVHARQVKPHRPPEGLPAERSRRLARGRRRGGRAAGRGASAGDPGRRRDPSIRPAGRIAVAGRIDRDADRDDDPGQERDLRGPPALRRGLRGGDGPRRGHRAGRVGRLPADARLLPDRHQPGDLHRQARPVEVHRRDQRGPEDPPPPLSRRPARRLHPRPDRASAERGADRRSRSDPTRSKGPPTPPRNWP